MSELQQVIDSCIATYDEDGHLTLGEYIRNAVDEFIAPVAP